MGIMGMMAMHSIRVAKATSMGQHLGLVCAACFLHSYAHFANAPLKLFNNELNKQQCKMLTDGAGDVIGVIYNQAERTISYTKNGLYLGVAFQHVFEERLFPTVSPRSPYTHDTILKEFRVRWKCSSIS